MNKKLFKEIMDNYTKYRAEWILKHGTDKGFDQWFANQVCGK